MESVQPATQPIRVRKSHDTLWNILTFIVLLSTLCVALAFLVVFINPRVPLNPFPPSVQAMEAPGLLPSPTPTSTEIPPRDIFPPTWTPAPSQSPADGQPTPQATSTPDVFPQDSPDATPPANGFDYTFAVQGTPAAVPSTLIKAYAGCSWLGVAGQAVDIHGSAVTGLLVKITGTLSGGSIDLTAMTGTETLYGDGGYELMLADQPVDSAGELRVQLFDNALLPLSSPVVVDTYNDCKRNMILVNFRQVRE